MVIKSFVVKRLTKLASKLLPRVDAIRQRTKLFLHNCGFLFVKRVATGRLCLLSVGTAVSCT